jgi:Flp pilus assembly protein TadG
VRARRDRGPRERGPGERGPRERGQSLAECAIILPLFLILVVGVVEVAGAMNAYITVISSARDGARLGSKGLATDTEIKNLIVAETGHLREPVDPAADINVTHSVLGGVNAVNVTVCNDHPSLLNVPLMPDSFRICSTTVMRQLDPS